MGLLDALKRKDINEGIERFRKTEGAVLLDVREKDEYVQGHVPGSINLPLSRISSIPYEKGTILFVYCLSGARSSRACRWLDHNGYEAVNIGGIADYHGRLE